MKIVVGGGDLVDDDVVPVQRDLATVLEVVVLQLRPHEPGGGLHLVLDGAGPRTHVSIADQRHRRNLIRPMARDTRVVEDRRNVVGKCRLSRNLCECASRHEKRRRKNGSRL